MISEVIMPKLGQTMEEGTIAKWHKAEGDKVEKGEVLLEITTDKATLEVEAYASGILKKILAEEDEVIPVGQVIAYIGEENDEIPELPESKKVEPGLEEKTTVEERGYIDVEETEPEDVVLQPSTMAPIRPGGGGEVPDISFAGLSMARPGRIIASPRARTVAREKGVDLSYVTGTGPNGRIVEKDVLNYISSQPKIKISPVARKIAREKGIHIYAIKGTGPGGRITKEDVLAYQPEAKPTAVSGPPLSSELLPLSPMRKTIAQRMTQSKTSAPHFYLRMDIDMSACVKEREALKQQGKKISYNDFIIRACALSIREFPIVAAFYTKDGIQMRSQINIGLAVSIDDGLIVPVIKSADQKSLEQIAADSQVLIEKARSKKLIPDDYTGGVLTISNLGMFDITEFFPIINPGESAIIGVGKIADRIVLKEGLVTTQKIMMVTMSCDHRVIDGVVGAKFLQRVKQLLENPARL